MTKDNPRDYSSPPPCWGWKGGGVWGLLTLPCPDVPSFRTLP